MRLFRYTNVDALVVSPQVGGHRHGGEDPRAVGKAVLWLSDCSMMMHPLRTFECEVEIDEDDPLLFVDERAKAMARGAQRMFGAGDPPLWYWYEGSIDVSTRRAWDSPTSCYI